MRAEELHQWIARVAPSPWLEVQVDGIVAGSPETEVTGVAVTWLPTLDVLKRAAANGLNFVIAHEPLFYLQPYYCPYGDSHWVLQDPEGLERKMATPPAQAKQKVIDEHDLVVYRFHDGWDGFPGYGMGPPLEEALGWRDRRVSDEFIYELAPTTVQELAATIARKLARRGARFTGDPARSVERVTLDWGSPGASGIVLKALENRCDASITGEVVDWRDVEFARDAGVALIVAGHCATETPGMRSFYRWFKPQWPDVRVEFFDAGDPDGFVVVDSSVADPA